MISGLWRLQEKGIAEKRTRTLRLQEGPRDSLRSSLSIRRVQVFTYLGCSLQDGRMSLAVVVAISMQSASRTRESATPAPVDTQRSCSLPVLRSWCLFASPRSKWMVVILFVPEESSQASMMEVSGPFVSGLPGFLIRILAHPCACPQQA